MKEGREGGGREKGEGRREREAERREEREGRRNKANEQWDTANITEALVLKYSRFLYM